MAGSLAQKLDAARGPLKVLRNAETAIAPRRAMRVNLHNQIVRMLHDQPKGSERKLAELKELLRKTELEDQPHENEFEILKRKAIRESEAAKWQAIREVTIDQPISITAHLAPSVWRETCSSVAGCGPYYRGIAIDPPFLDNSLWWRTSYRSRARVIAESA